MKGATEGEMTEGVSEGDTECSFSILEWSTSVHYLFFSLFIISAGIILFNFPLLSASNNFVNIVFDLSLIYIAPSPIKSIKIVPIFYIYFSTIFGLLTIASRT